MIELLSTGRTGSPAIIDCQSGVAVPYGALTDSVAAASRELRRYSSGSLVIQICTNTIDSIVLYLACLEGGFPVCLLPGDAGACPARLLDCYRPRMVLFPAGMPQAGISRQFPFPGTGYTFGFPAPDDASPAVHPDNALLLTTSGTTGTPKMVRLALRNVIANARSIVSYLALNPDERSIQSLPMHYSYGLSLINSHLLAGATVVLTPHSFYSPEFWCDFDCSACTSFAGVPYMYEALCRVQFDPSAHRSLRTLTQAGGALRRDLTEAVLAQARGCGVRFFVMYGQTEATARISYVPPERLGEKIGSIGVPVPGGRMETAPPVDGAADCELVYSGPNVMLGYAESAVDLSSGDQLNGTLHTGDLVRRDSEGFFYLTGRLGRFAKLFGRRISLADVETELETAFPVRAAAIEENQRLCVFLEREGDVEPAAVASRLARCLRVPRKFISVSGVAALPLTANGKKDYKALSEGAL